MSDSYNLERFLQAQRRSYADAKAELSTGRKTTHWMWFIFPQAKGLGSSEISRRFAIQSLDEARAFLSHPVLGTRLKELTRLVLSQKDPDIDQIFGSLDAMKFRSSMTLFSEVAEPNSIFSRAIDQCCDGLRDGLTLD